jgi:hypothetical protein
MEWADRADLRLMARSIKKLRPHQFNRRKKRLALNAPGSLLRKISEAEPHIKSGS